jgi:hypothetical protein
VKKKLLHLLGMGFFVHEITDEAIQENKTPPNLSKILSEFAHVFEEPAGLPPTRNHDHRIPLLPNQSPVNIRPYMYPHHQKTKIKIMVKEFLKIGIIH